MTAQRAALPLFVVGVVGAGILVGMLFTPGAWQAGLAKSAFNPPDWLFAPVRAALYALIGVVGWRMWFRSGRADLRGLWIAQMVPNLARSPAFFGARSPGLGLAVILPLPAVVLAVILRARAADPPSALMVLPYAARLGLPRCSMRQSGS